MPCTMASLTNNLLLPLLLLATLSTPPALCYVRPADARFKQDSNTTSAYHTYIVLVKPSPNINGEDAHHRWYESFLPSSLTDSGEPRLVHSYTEVFTGFAARLTVRELDVVAKNPGFVRAFPDRTLQLLTTRTPEFLGLRKDTGFWSHSSYGKGVVVGLLDTGIHALHPSFDDNGVPPPPAKWKGSCKAARCNNKLVGATSFVGGNTDDDDGHGTHLSSTAAGNFVPGASYHGLGAGTAAGIAPGAHIAMYKVCHDNDCPESTILAGMDASIKDGVDVLSLSLGGGKSVMFDQSFIAIGAFSAISRGIIVVCGAGNNGPGPGWVINDAPWLLTVAAGSVDRKFDATVHLGNGKHIGAEALTQVAKRSTKMYPLLYSKERTTCWYVGYNVSEKVVICDSGASDSDINGLMRAGVGGVVLTNDISDGYTIVLEDYNSSVVQMAYDDAQVLKAYAMSSANSSAAVSITYNNTLLGVRPAPTVASFSSQGPSPTIPGVLKPDVMAPGLNILAAWPPKTEFASGPFNIISGTSVATPHVSSVAALIKSLHPDWSPAAIKSAILTTADAVDNTGSLILDHQHVKTGAYAMGAGHVNPSRAADPGLVYDLGVQDYIDSSLTCEKLPKVQDVQLNYPTITVPLKAAGFTVNRTVTNVGPAASRYTVKVDVPKSLTVRVSPTTLAFSKSGEKKTFSVSVSGKEDEKQVEGSLSWVSGTHVVRSPIVAVANLGN